MVHNDWTVLVYRIDSLRSIWNWQVIIILVTSKLCWLLSIADLSSNSEHATRNIRNVLVKVVHINVDIPRGLWPSLTVEVQLIQILILRVSQNVSSSHECVGVAQLSICILLPRQELIWCPTCVWGYFSGNVSELIDSGGNIWQICVQVWQHIYSGQIPIIVFHTREYIHRDPLNSIVIAKEINQQLLVLRFKLSDLNAIDIRDLYLVSPYFQALCVRQKREGFPGSDIFSHFIEFLNEELIQ